jgi:hypothetical protein
MTALSPGYSTLKAVCVTGYSYCEAKVNLLLTLGHESCCQWLDPASVVLTLQYEATQSGLTYTSASWRASG